MRPLMKRPDVVELANDKVPIAFVCAKLGLSVGEDAGRRKLRCPFGGIYHSDGGIEPTLRIYVESNHAYCFNCNSHYVPVTLAARAWGCSHRDAALRLLEYAGIEPVDFRSIWAEVQEHRREPDRSLMAEALKVYCRRIDPTWTRRQFEPAVAARLTRCLVLLDLVKTDDDVLLWLTTCKEAMRRLLVDDPS